MFIETGPHKHAVQQTFFLYVYEPGGNRVEVANAGAPFDSGAGLEADRVVRSRARERPGLGVKDRGVVSHLWDPAGGDNACKEILTRHGGRIHRKFLAPFDMRYVTRYD